MCLHEASRSHSEKTRGHRRNAADGDEAQMDIQHDRNGYTTAQLDDVVNGLAGFDPMDFDNTMSFLDFWNPAATPSDNHPHATDWLNM